VLVSDDAAEGTAARYSSRNARIVADASALLSRSFELETTLAAMARVALPALGDHCWVDIVEYEGNIVRLHVARRDVEVERREALGVAPVNTAANPKLTGNAAKLDVFGAVNTGETLVQDNTWYADNFNEVTATLTTWLAG